MDMHASWTHPVAMNAQRDRVVGENVSAASCPIGQNCRAVCARGALALTHAEQSTSHGNHSFYSCCLQDFVSELNRGCLRNKQVICLMKSRSGFKTVSALLLLWYVYGHFILFFSTPRIANWGQVLLAGVWQIGFLWLNQGLIEF